MTGPLKTATPIVRITTVMSDGTFRGVNQTGNEVRVDMNGKGKALETVFDAWTKARRSGLDLHLQPVTVKVPAEWVAEF